MTESYAGLRAVLVEDMDEKAEKIQGLLVAGGVRCLGRLASMGEVLAALKAHRLSEGASGLLADGNLFFVDGNLSPKSSDGRDGNEVLIAFAEKGIAYPASYLSTYREQALSVHGIAFGCSRDIGDAGYANAMLDYNLYPGDPDVKLELRRMLDLAIELLPAEAQ